MTRDLISPASWRMSKRERRTFLTEVGTQILPALVLSSIGAFMTGELLKTLETWRVFIRVEELFILVPILLNLKGNLEMNLAARFSTSANIGELDLRTTRQVLVRGNLALLQVQALLVSAFAGLLAFALGMLSRHGVVTTSSPLTQEQLELRGSYFEAAMVLCVSMLAASLSSGLLGSFMTSLVILSRRFLVNPDNVATPIAAVLGDLLTLTILGLVSAAFARVMGTLVSTAVVALLLAAVAFNIWLTYRNAYVRELLLVGWTPLLLAMLIASGAGVVLESLVDEYDGFALIAPVVTAIAGATGAILVSRMTTALHSGTKQSTQFTPVMLALLGLSLPLLLLFIVICAVTAQAPINLFAFFAFAISFVVLVPCSLGIAYVLTLWLWKKDYDPDVYCLPLLTSVVDVIGEVLLVAAFRLTMPTRDDQAAAAAGTGEPATAGIGIETATSSTLVEAAATATVSLLRRRFA